ncbi:helix-turn-helix domain-containing protein [Fibrella arboris]|uniref:helix-turn-helix domain-containing protein n=1 Tax=Fibrella arboris TaxID=3242486 RepID=UPI0035202859
MIVDFNKIADEVSETRQLVQSLLDRLNQPIADPAPVEETPLNVQQAAELLDVTPATVYDLVHKRRIPSHRPGKRLYFLRSELMQWIKNGRRNTADELVATATRRPTRQQSKGGRNAL